MIRLVSFAMLLLAIAASANAHFLFVVPEENTKGANVILSEDLQVDEAVSADAFAAATLSSVDSSGAEKPLATLKSQHAYRAEIGGTGTRLIRGLADLGVQQRGEGKPFLLRYYSRTVLANALDFQPPVAHAATVIPVELLAIGEPGKTKFRLLANGKPIAGAEVNLILPNGSHEKVSTDESGATSTSFTQLGRYGAWARHVEPSAGESGGKKYEEIRRYATLVVDVVPAVLPTRYAAMPEHASSFGAVASGGWLYLYGGHVVDTHSYSTDSVSGRFARLNLFEGKTWETLPGGPALQGMNLAAFRGKIYRVGGMNPRNKSGEPTDVRSIAGCARFDPASGQWSDLPDLPEPRSSHDVVVLNNKLYVIGGWSLGGEAGDAKWFDTALSLDLTAEHPTWQSIAQPFQRRALIAAAHRGKIYVMGGFQSESEASLRVDIYDPTAGTWSRGPDLPGPEHNGFGPAAACVGENLFVSVGDGSFLRLDEAGEKWIRVAGTTPRIVHRLASVGSQVLVIGGAAEQKQLDLIETVQVERPSAAAVGQAAD